MRRKLTIAMLLSLSAAGSPLALALGVGEADVRSTLNAPLRAVVPLTDTAGLDPERLKVSVADTREFESAGLARTPLAASVRADVEVHQGQWVVKLASERVVREPWMDLLLRFDWPDGRQFRELTLLVDPPNYDQLPVLVDGTAASRRAVSERDATEVATAAEDGTAVRQPLPSGRGEPAWVGSGDTLWSVASRLRPDSDISMDQMMVALVEANPEVFPSGNINAMRAGHALAVPSRDAIASRSPAEAERIVQAMNQVWANRGSGPPARVPLGLPASAPIETAAVQAAQAIVPETPSPEAAAVETTPAASEEGAEAPVSNAEPPRLTLLSDAELAAEVARNVASEGLSAQGSGPRLDARVLATLGAGNLTLGRSDPGLDRLARQWQENQAALEEVKAERDAMERELSALRGEVDAMRDQLTALLADGAGAEEDVGPESVVTQAPRPEAEPWWGALYPGRLDRNLILGGAGLAALLGLWLWVRRRRQREAASSKDFSSMPSVVHGMPPSAIAMPTAGTSMPPMAASMTVDSAKPEEASPERVAMPQAEAISEADIFMAYGRYDQARELLEAGLEHEPERHDLRLKLLKVQVEQGHWEAAEREVQKLAEAGDSTLLAEAGRLMARRQAARAGAGEDKGGSEPDAMPAGEAELNDDTLPVEEGDMPAEAYSAETTPADIASVHVAEGEHASEAAPLQAETRPASEFSRGETPLDGVAIDASSDDTGERKTELTAGADPSGEEGDSSEEEALRGSPSLTAEEGTGLAPPDQAGAVEWDVIDYQPPSLDPEPPQRVETPMQPSVDFTLADFPSEDDRERDETVSEPEWEVEEVAFPPLDPDNDGLPDQDERQRELDRARRLLEDGEPERARPVLRRLAGDGDPRLRDQAQDLITHYRL
ncbi:type IV pilus assembly protein FimV [Billgrantia saliphila]|uniref:type IV pilus assembly protein FimV n=1 Tax=Billgrantia saliphila TaxID=1848458 RepID=UPI000CE4360F|nr:FimV/HubP family polar landmark protein [Halomonas saliphila]